MRTQSRAKTFWIVTDHDFFRHDTPEAAEVELARLAAKHPEKKFRVMRCKRDVRSADEIVVQETVTPNGP